MADISVLSTGLWQIYLYLVLYLYIVFCSIVNYMCLRTNLYCKLRPLPVCNRDFGAGFWICLWPVSCSHVDKKSMNWESLFQLTWWPIPLSKWLITYKPSDRWISPTYPTCNCFCSSITNWDEPPSRILWRSYNQNRFRWSRWSSNIFPAHRLPLGGCPLAICHRI